ncbi:MAG: ribosomal protein S18 acetylase RimI-like enzyme [Parasphingorhabdus sp.]|jgi:ribosomal protein S18 acetylase RimI-like enzyme
MTNEVYIRSAIADDAEKLTNIAILGKAHWGYSEKFMHHCRNELQVLAIDIDNTKHQFHVAVISDQCVGFYELTDIDNIHSELDALFVLPAYMRRGIGKRLMENAMNFARQNGIQYLHIQSDPNAVDFYLKAGANLIGQSESGSFSGRMLPLLKLDL